MQAMVIAFTGNLQIVNSLWTNSCKDGLESKGMCSPSQNLGSACHIVQNSGKSNPGYGECKTDSVWPSWKLVVPDLRVARESGSRSNSEGGEILLHETEKTQLEETYPKTRDGLEPGYISQGDTKSEKSAIYAFRASEIELYETARLEKGTEATSSAAESGANEIKSDEWEFSSDELEPAQVEFSEEESPKCDYSVGEWVLDDSRPLYSGRECKLWIASFSCSLNGRPDLSYEKFRWQPSGCDLPEFDGRTFLNMCVPSSPTLFYLLSNVRVVSPTPCEEVRVCHGALLRVFEVRSGKSVVVPGCK